jgi:hypothetical protein
VYVPKVDCNVKAAVISSTWCSLLPGVVRSSLVLGLSNELLSFNYRETFVNAFEVANKVVEMLMMRGGVDVCCTTDEDAARLARFSSSNQVDPTE